MKTIRVMVYPRACGGTTIIPSSATLVLGLSPRLRGNRPLPLATRFSLRSIPAPAGEPSRRGAWRNSTWVYPRACGGTDDPPGMASGSSGLSPRLRGNRVRPRGATAGAGSIPAPAGEPFVWSLAKPAWSVYPRACGGTNVSDQGNMSVGGLSPRLRGNLDSVLADDS